jgi:transposase
VPRRIIGLYLRRLLVVGATAVLRIARQRGGGAWVMGLLERKKPKAAAVALANKTARIAWVLMSRKENFRPATV